MQDRLMIVADPEGAGYKFARGVFNYVRNKGTRDFSVEFADVERTNFRDTEYITRVSNNIRKSTVFYVHDPNLRGDRWVSDLNFTMDAIRGASPVEVTVVFPYFRYGRQDRKSASRTSVNAKSVAKMVSEYANRVLTMDLHADQISGFFDIPVDGLPSAPVLVEHLATRHPEYLDNLVVVSPDPGGGKRAQNLVGRLAKKGIEAGLAVGYKYRPGPNVVGEVRIAGDVRDKKCLIVDDIIDTGGTQQEAAKTLRTNGATHLYAWGTHPLFTRGTEGFDDFDSVMISDTLKSPAGIDGLKNFEIISMVNMFGEAVYRTMHGESLSSLFE